MQYDLSHQVGGFTVEESDRDVDNNNHNVIRTEDSELESRQISSDTQKMDLICLTICKIVKLE